MTREIKKDNFRELEFRAWDGKEMIEMDGIKLPNTTDPNRHMGIAIMQYTGLRDKNGKKIFEGDIVRVYYLGWHTSEVKYMSNGFYIKTNGHKEDVRENLELTFPFKEIEIIGNVYQNPELIK